MQSVLGRRTLSLAAASFLVAAAFIAAITQRFHLIAAPTPDGPPTIEIAHNEPPPPPPPAPQPRQAAPNERVSALPPPIALDPAPDAQPEPAPDIAPRQPDPAPVITRPDWLQRPANLAAYYPVRAERQDREGLVELDCIVRTSGALACAVAQETPPGWGFGQAALRIAADHRMVPATRDGLAVEARYRMRVPFALD